MSHFHASYKMERSELALHFGKSSPNWLLISFLKALFQGVKGPQWCITMSQLEQTCSTDGSGKLEKSKPKLANGLRWHNIHPKIYTDFQSDVELWSYMVVCIDWQILYWPIPSSKSTWSSSRSQKVVIPSKVLHHAMAFPKWRKRQ